MEFSFEALKNPERWLDIGLPILGHVLAALAVFFIGRWITAALVRFVHAAMLRARMDETLANFLCNVLRGLALAVVIIAALGQLGVETTSAVAMLGGAALAVGLALQQQLSSFAAGVILILFRPFKRGDFVNINGTMGVVEEVKIVHTVLKTLDNQLVYVPNANITTNNITNFSALPTRRIDLTVAIGYGSDLRKAKAVLQQLIDEEPRKLPEPAPTIQVKELADSSVNFAVRFWVNSSDWWTTLCDMTERIKLAFDEHGIEIPFPQRSVHIEGLAELLPKRPA
ncbi:mechanosensitive ion channel family protein [Sinimarinibacterium thermocellulolyticum]|uniref:Small-conductance mechanosensitive channel n=1 Tax=Sinimarinibacterium thermocellulolyticum TaxID=3170016 RepID=A0ABV2AD28_9GAMM